ncbi:hypothetical protein J5N97_018727 [Dioscorea zingiberensis]|uniref:SKP1-like protein n=1 Tax=Dioscorea zingiberensis TaxID=325984 RepID=A0A9D5CCN8_9LILI|nr:hypothetical protein J5N97_018727 [Dioscorea zingiberensis]
MASERNQEVKQMVTLKSKDGKQFQVERKVAEQSKVIKLLAEQFSSHSLKTFIDDEDGYIDTPIPVEVTSDVLQSVILYCEKHSEEPARSVWEEKVTQHRPDVLIQWDSKYIEEVKKNKELLYNLIIAANYLEIEGLLDLTIQAVVDMIEGKSPEEIRSILGITNDLTPEEEHEIRQQNLWAFTPN